MNDYMDNGHGESTQQGERSGPDEKLASEPVDWSRLSRSQKWATVNERFQKAERGKGTQKRYRLSPVICDLIGLISEDLGIDDNTVVEHAILGFYRNLMDPYREGFRDVQNSLELLSQATDQLASEIAVFSAVAVHIAVAETPTEESR